MCALSSLLLSYSRIFFRAICSSGVKANAAASGKALPPLLHNHRPLAGCPGILQRC
jgi:hypothetical protein